MVLCCIFQLTSQAEVSKKYYWPGYSYVMIIMIEMIIILYMQRIKIKA